MLESRGNPIEAPLIVYSMFSPANLMKWPDYIFHQHLIYMQSSASEVISL
ncbi:MAG: hypothetical protein WCP79_14900 [Bacillota bacterium]